MPAGASQQRPISTFSFATSVSPFGRPSVSTDPTDEELYSALKNYINMQNVMTVQKKAAIEPPVKQLPLVSGVTIKPTWPAFKQYYHHASRSAKSTRSCPASAFAAWLPFQRSVCACFEQLRAGSRSLRNHMIREPNFGQSPPLLSSIQGYV
ncbi:hypothetical protein M378DRAFT_9775 [Amanita muscaria Koide BX008]|uniref:Uncharacterized protein n=1 Tax=Amanita muscaria (strain Koide BX008) TaxID=946122 RepID=A0A0C2XCM0_AMAMK|nr:hypothetical protein M378DRAFT_9775 [Amanita muscaria Koide BX008]